MVQHADGHPCPDEWRESTTYSLSNTNSLLFLFQKRRNLTDDSLYLRWREFICHFVCAYQAKIFDLSMQIELDP